MVKLMDQGRVTRPRVEYQVEYQVDYRVKYRILGEYFYISPFTKYSLVTHVTSIARSIKDHNPTLIKLI